MKSVSLALLTAAVSVAAAVPHAGHRHAHLHKRATEVAWIPGPTVVAYVLNGQSIPEDEVKQGIANGTLVWSNGGIQQASEVSSTSSPVAQATSTYAPASSAPPESSAAPATSDVSTSQVSNKGWGGHHGRPGGGNHGGSSSSPSSGSSWGGSGQGVDTTFPDGELSCDEFPSSYGAVSVSWAGLGGWTGVQTPGSTLGGFSNIMTALSGSGGCTEGSFCSYACPPGYQKSQWPTTQGATGQSVGGIECKNGKLYLTNQALSDKLCIPGASNVNVQVQNKMSEQVAVCRTDYPGTESETVPLDSQPGSTDPLTCPDASNYYTWQGAHTSAQYYVNPKGVSVEDGCQWGSNANPWGNFAPMNLGVGYSNGAAWLSIFQNSPTTNEKLDFAVEIVGDGISGTCKYSNGQYCGGANYDDCSSTTGCTVSLASGTATFVFTDA